MRLLLINIVFSGILLSVSAQDFNNLQVQLSLPANESKIQEKEPLLSWQMNSGIQTNDPRLSVVVVVCEMQDAQTASEAVLENLPIVQRNNYQGTSLQYTSSDKALVAGKRYAWQVQFYSQGLMVSQSEAWWFELETEHVIPLAYIPLKKKIDGSHIQLQDNDLLVCIQESGPIQLGARIRFADGTEKETKLVELVGKEEFKGESSEVNAVQRNLCLHTKELKLKKGIYTLIYSPRSGVYYENSFEVK
jgi:hypothetical protein